MEHPHFTMSKYGSAEELYRDKAEYYQKLVEKMELKDSRAESVSCVLAGLNFEEYTVTLDVPQSVMQKGFHAGNVDVNFKEVQ